MGNNQQGKSDKTAEFGNLLTLRHAKPIKPGQRLPAGQFLRFGNEIARTRT
jgi:hypothetical protein